MDFSSLYIEKYRPHTLEEIILPDSIRAKVTEYKDTQEIPHLLFSGASGQGKSSLALIIVKDVLQCDYLYINASDNNGIDTIRTKVIPFAQTRSLDGRLKVIIMDEGHNISFEAQSALNNVMEQYAASTRFIFTTNFAHKIIKSIRSRCTAFTFEHKLQDVIKHCYSILQKENVAIPTDQKAAFVEVVKNCFPDIRLAINELFRCTVKGTLCLSNIREGDIFVSQLFDTIKSDPYKARQHYIQSEQLFQGDYHFLLKMLVQLLYKDAQLLSTLQRREALILITDHMCKHAFVADPEINFFSCCLQLNKLVT